MRALSPRLTAALAAAPLLVLPPSVHAQRYAPIVVLWPGGTRYAAMANAAVAVRGDEALFYNPAGIGAEPPRLGPRPDTLQVHDASVAWQHGGTGTLRAVGAAFATGRLGVGIGARHLALEASALPLSPSRLEDEDAGPASSTVVAAGVARDLLGLRVGAALGYGEDRAGDRRVGRTMVDLGVTRDILIFGWPRGALQVGAAVRHLGGSSTVNGVRVRAPTAVTVGANVEGYPRGSFDLSGGVGVTVLRGGRVIPRLGGEVAWFWIEGYAVVGRAGVRRPEYDGQSAVTLGAGLVRDNLSLDYAFEPGDDGPAAHRIGLRVR